MQHKGRSKVKEVLLAPCCENDTPPSTLVVVEVLCDFEKPVFKGIRKALIGKDFSSLIHQMMKMKTLPLKFLDVLFIRHSFQKNCPHRPHQL